MHPGAKPSVSVCIRGEWKGVSGPIRGPHHVVADGGYAGDKLKGALEGLGNWTIEIVKRFGRGEGLRSVASPLGNTAQGPARVSVWDGSGGDGGHHCPAQPWPAPRQGLINRVDSESGSYA
jgi:hypothetical protein